MKIEYFRQIFSELLGGEQHADLRDHLRPNGTPWVAIYEWMIMKRSGARMLSGIATDKTKRNVRDYHDAAWDMAVQMINGGFTPDGAIPVDESGELLDGSHRLAAAIAGGADEVYVQRVEQNAWAPAWDEDWFDVQGMAPEYTAEIVRLYEAWRGRG